MAGNNPTDITLSRYDDVRDAYRHKDLAQSLYDEAELVMGDALIVLHGREHQARRRLENRLFRRETFRFYERELIPPAIDEQLAPLVSGGGGDLVPFGRRVVINLTAMVAGVDRPTGSAAESEALYQYSCRFSEGATIVHSTRPKDEVRAEVAAAIERFDADVFRPSLERRRRLIARVDDGELADDALPRDVLTVLARNADALELPDDVIRREVTFYLQAGMHSTANSFTHAVHEIFTWLAGAGPADDDRVRSDPLFLQRCVHESMRLHPASPVGQRRARAPIELRNGTTVDTGGQVTLDLMAANRDVAVFGADAHEFNPHRTVRSDAAPWGHTFGGGMHACIGMELDGGLASESGTDPAEHLYGTVPLMIGALLAHGARPDPDDLPTLDTSTARRNWGRYPVRLRLDGRFQR